MPPTRFPVRFHLVMSEDEGSRADNSGSLLLTTFPGSTKLSVYVRPPAVRKKTDVMIKSGRVKPKPGAAATSNVAEENRSGPDVQVADSANLERGLLDVLGLPNDPDNCTGVFRALLDAECTDEWPELNVRANLKEALRKLDAEAPVGENGDSPGNSRGGRRDSALDEAGGATSSSGALNRKERTAAKMAFRKETYAEG